MAGDAEATGPVQWDEVPEASQRYIAHLVNRLASGFTGRIEVQCIDGGIRDWKETQSVRPEAKAA